MQTQKGFTSFELLTVVFAIVFAVGWIMNIFDIVSIINDPVTGMFILRCIGIVVAPLGAILGYF